MNNNFSDWLNNTTNLSDSSICKYYSAIRAISKDMISKGVINKSLFQMNPVEIDFAISIILRDISFINKDLRGNSMYSCALKYYRVYAFENNDSDEQYENIIKEINNSFLAETEKEALVKSRRGQGTFRESLMEKYSSTCIVTGINLKTLLIASHVKPWSVSNNYERLSSENGLLLSATFDKLFDKGYISFKNNGQMIISHHINEENKKRLNISSNVYVNLLPTSELLNNLEYHRDIIFIK